MPASNLPLRFSVITHSSHSILKLFKDPLKFIVDECIGPGVAKWLEGFGHDVVSISQSGRGSEDIDILLRSIQEKRILLTNDKDFGDLVFRDRMSHNGIILLRSEDETTKNKIQSVQYCLNNVNEDLEKCFIVISEKSGRISLRVRKTD